MADSSNTSGCDTPDFDPAMDWAAKLVLGSLNEDEQSQLSDWLAGRPDRAALIEEALDAFELPATALAAALAGPSETVVSGPKPASTIRRAWWPAIGLAAAAAIAISFSAIWLLPSMRTALGAPVETIIASGEDRTLTLEDGSQILLARGSIVELDLRGDQRGARLLQGEALFDIASDPTRPFTVTTDQGDVRVLGTEFNVSLWKDGATIAVLEGLVSWQSEAEGDAIPLSAGHGLSVIYREPAARFEIDITDPVDWRTGWVSAQSMPLGEVLAKLERYSGATINLSSDVSPASPVSGRFRLSQTDATLEAVAALYDLNIERAPDQIMLSADGDRRN